MKIALVVHDFLSGTGHGRYCIELARRFSIEHEVHVLANRFEANLEFPYRQRFVKTWRVSALTAVMTFPSAAQRILDRNTFDIVHAQGFSCRRADVITAHVCNAARYKQAPARGFLKRLFPALVIPRERDFFRTAGATAIISVSRVMQRELLAEYGVSSDVVYHGINANEFSPAETPPQNIWLYVGEAVKGLADAITALPKFPNARLRVVTRSQAGPFRTLAHRLGVGTRVDFEGPQNAMNAVFRGASLFVYPSEYDSFGMVVVEAMASGVIVAIGRKIGAAEWIQDGQNGFLCDPADLETTLARIERLSPAELETIRQSARDTALEHSWDHCAAETMARYQRAMASKPAKK